MMRKHLLVAHWHCRAYFRSLNATRIYGTSLNNLFSLFLQIYNLRVWYRLQIPFLKCEKCMCWEAAGTAMQEYFYAQRNVGVARFSLFVHHVYGAGLCLMKKIIKNISGLRNDSFLTNMPVVSAVPTQNSLKSIMPCHVTVEKIPITVFSAL